MGTAPFIQTSKNCKVYKFRRMRFFAERGTIHIIDEEHGGDYKPCSRTDFLLRAAAFNDEARRIDSAHGNDRLELIRMVEAMVQCAREAREQGCPYTDREVKRARQAPRPTPPPLQGNARRLILPGSF